MRLRLLSSLRTALTVLSPSPAALFPHEFFSRPLVLVLGAISPFVFTVVVQGRIVQLLLLLHKCTLDISYGQKRTLNRGQ